jgi:type I restriction enzyme S subunit
MMSEELKVPGHWEIKKLGEVAKVKGGKRLPKGDSYSETATIFPYLRVTDFENQTINTDKIKFLKESTQKAIKNYTIAKEDAYISIAGTIGLTGTVPNKLDGANLTENAAKITDLKDCNNKYLSLFLSSILGQSQIKEFTKTTTQPKLSLYRIDEIQIPLPPLPEQHAIVAKIEELLSDLENGKQQLQTAQQQLKIYRQSLLKAAFDGKLTTEWREKTSELGLNRLKDDKINSKNFESQILQSSNPTNHNSDSGELPKGWKWVTPIHISSPEKYSIGIGPFGSNLKVCDYTSSGIPLVFVKNITRNDFTLVPRYISKEKFIELKAHSVKPLDILITKMGDPPGDCAIYPALAPEAIITADCLKFRINEKLANRQFVFYSLQTLAVKKQFGSITKGVAQKKISTQRFRNILLPFPPLEEQNLIVSFLESRLTICDNIAATITQSLAQAETLRQSILKKAFEGKLTHLHPPSGTSKRRQDSLDLPDEYDVKKKPDKTSKAVV